MFEIIKIFGQKFVTSYPEQNSSSNSTQLPIKVRTYEQVINYLVLLQLFLTYQIFKNESQFSKNQKNTVKYKIAH